MHTVFESSRFLLPELSMTCQTFFRTAYGILFLGTLLMALPQWRRFFVSERWGGYAKSSPLQDFLQNPFVTTCIGIAWFSCTLCLVFNFYPVLAAAVNLIICRYFFIEMRWRGVLRGMGAPGFMSYWLAAAVFILEFTAGFAPSARSLAILVLQVDFAFIMLSAGIYKYTAGYATNEGMEYGMVNPEWGYWWRAYKNLSPSNWLFKTFNHLAWSTEVVAAILMLVPQTRFIGGMLILLSFVFIATHIRLGLLCEMVMLGCVLFFHSGSYGDQAVALLFGHDSPLSSFMSSIVPSLSSPAPVAVAQNDLVSMLTNGALWTYLLLLPLAHAGLFYNFYGKKSLPQSLQKMLETYTNFFGLIIWRVFSVDVINFFPLIYLKNRQTAERSRFSNYGWQGGFRYNHVGESITVTSLFTTLKYYATNQNLFNERILRYARTLPCPTDCVIEFEYMSIKKLPDRFEFVPIAIYTVDLMAESVEEQLLDQSVSVHAIHKVSPVHEGGRPGSYVPLGG